jgi:hypothetical protein
VIEEHGDDLSRSTDVAQQPERVAFQDTFSTDVD